MTTQKNKNILVDNNNRVINYLRLSITDRCNLRCIYCMSEEGIDFLDHAHILRYEEILHLVRLSVQKGIRKVRLTGGEPLVRKGFTGFLKRLNNVEGLKEITLTTNGVLLKDFAPDIKACGVHRVNISLDTLKRERFARITGRDLFDQVWEGILEAERLGFEPIKINVVAMKGINDDEIRDFARLTLKKPYHIRFIEQMPVGADSNWTPDKFLPILDIYNIIRDIGNLKPIHKRNALDGPARRYVLEGAKGEIGLIGALSNHFCTICNRLRMTAEGHLRSCLFSEQEIDIKTPLRKGAGDDELLRLLEKAIQEKPKGHDLTGPGLKNCARPMSSIGG
ncbi:MAG TPA: GTP 3',8-cyclase MoaA [Desulfobacteraceae bacterium]|nr:GTP 3',8-cyclase MoaA [Desulfobacteraceae bacterium]